MRRRKAGLTGPAPALAMGPGIVVHRVAEAQLRGVSGSVRARIYVPMPAGDSSRPGMLVFLPAGGVFSYRVHPTDNARRNPRRRASAVGMAPSYRPLPPTPI